MVLVSFIVESNLALPWVPEIFFSRVTRGFVGLRPKTQAAKPREKTFRAGHSLRHDRNRKPRMKKVSQGNLA